MFDCFTSDDASPRRVTECGFLDDMAPGILLAAVLEEIDVTALDGADRVFVLRAHDRMASYHAAQRSRALASLVFVDEFEEFGVEDTFHAAAAEARVALHLTRRAADTELSTALDLHDRLPEVWEAWRQGLLDARRVQVILERTAHLEPDEARIVAGQVLPAAPSLTTGQLKARVDRIAMEADPAAAERRFADAIDDRRLVLESTETGTANLAGFDLSPIRAGVITRRINHHARSLKRSGDDRTMDQLRADVFLDLLEGRSSGVDGGTLELRVDLATLAGLADHPGELNGYGPVIADIARQAAAAQDRAAWQYTVTDGASVVATGTTRRRPTAAVARAVRAADPTCVFPGCRMPASECDLDHRVEWSKGGATEVANLAPLCRHDHRIRHLPGWGYTPRSDGRFAWTTALGQTCVTVDQPP